MNTKNIELIKISNGDRLTMIEPNNVDANGYLKVI